MLQRDAEEEWGMKAQSATSFSVSERRAGGAVQDEGGFEVRACTRVLNPADLFAKVKALGQDGATLVVEGFGRRKQAAETPAKISRAGEIRFRVRRLPTQGEDASGSGNLAQQGFGIYREEFEAMVELEGRWHCKKFSLLCVGTEVRKRCRIKVGTRTGLS